MALFISRYIYSLKVLFLALICSFSFLYSENTLPVFSKNEIEHLEDIFDHLFKFESFTYTLFADKPMSFENISTSNTNHISLRNYCVLFSYKKPINYLETSWNVWQSKYSTHKFNNYIFFEKRYSNYITIILINKKAFSKTFEMNKKIFQKV